jgi:hypothetical protein
VNATTQRLIHWLVWRLPPCDVDALRALKACLLRRRAFPEMTTPEEQEFFRESARAVAREDGAIVDLGCWMGSTTIALARGVMNSGAGGRKEPRNRIHAFDVFVWEAWMEANLNDVSCDYQPGDSFLPRSDAA